MYNNNKSPLQKKWNLSFLFIINHSYSVKLHSLGLSVSAVFGVLGTGVLLIDTNILLDLSSTESFSLVSDNASEFAVLRREFSEV